MFKRLTISSLLTVGEKITVTIFVLFYIRNALNILVCVDVDVHVDVARPRTPILIFLQDANPLVQWNLYI